MTRLPIIPLTFFPTSIHIYKKDVAGRCICLLALDRFGDYSLGSAVAPVREIAGQLFALVLASWTEGSLVEQALVRLKSLVNDDDLWEVRHGGFVGLKYLVAVPNEVSKPSSIPPPFLLASRPPHFLMHPPYPHTSSCGILPQPF